MKITSKEIRLITDAIVEQVYDDSKINKQIEDELEKAWNEFAKTEQWKNTVKMLKLWRQLDWFEWISVRDFEFFRLKNPLSSCSYKLVSEEKAKSSFKNWMRWTIQNKLPQKWAVTKKVEALLTIKTLCWKDIENIMDDIIKTIKKEYKL